MTPSYLQYVLSIYLYSLKKITELNLYNLHFQHATFHAAILVLNVNIIFIPSSSLSSPFFFETMLNSRHFFLHFATPHTDHEAKPHGNQDHKENMKSYQLWHYKLPHLDYKSQKMQYREDNIANFWSVQWHLVLNVGTGSLISARKDSAFTPHIYFNILCALPYFTTKLGEQLNYEWLGIITAKLSIMPYN